MCRDVVHGGRRCPAANAISTAQRRVTRLTAALDAGGLSPQREVMLLKRLLVAYDRLAIARERATNPVQLPTRLVSSGQDFTSEGRELRCAVPGEVYRPNRHRPVVNRERVHGTVDPAGRVRTTPAGKPLGGLWFATVDEDGVSQWSRRMGFSDDFEVAAARPHEVRVAPDARVVVVHTWQDYTDLVDACGRDVPGEFDSPATRGIDYERLPADVIFIDEAAINTDKNSRRRWSEEAGQYVENKDMAGYESIEWWDLPSGIVLNKHAVTVTPLERPAGRGAEHAA